MLCLEKKETKQTESGMAATQRHGRYSDMAAVR
jgi:hypothetical protein